MRTPPIASAAVVVLVTIALSSFAQAAPRFATDHVIAKLRPDVAAGMSHGPVAVLPEQVPSVALRRALMAAGARSIEPVFPGFRPEDVHTVNSLGEKVTLEDLSVYYVVHLDPTATVDRALRTMAGAREVVSVDADPLKFSTSNPNDPQFPQQWWLSSVGLASCGVPIAIDQDINAPEAWDSWTGVSPSTKVGIIDTGIQPDHEDLVGRVELGPFPALDDNGHGTAVAGIVSANGNNGIGVSGVCQGVTVVSLKALNSFGQGSDLGVARGIDYSRTHGHPIVNMSLGGTGEEAVLHDAIVNGFKAGLLLVAGMGNFDGTDPNFFPAAQAREVFAVGALFNGVRWRDSLIAGCDTAHFGSTFGNWIDVSAPGGRAIVTTRWAGQNQGPYYGCVPCSGNEFGGTSAATPVVSGIAALLKSRYPLLTGEDLAQVIRLTCRDVTSYESGPGFDIYTGFGLVRADAALAFLASPNLLYQAQAANMTQVSSDVAQMTLNGIPGLANGTYNVTRYRMQTALTFGKDYVSAPAAWIRNSASLGTSLTNPNDPNYGAIATGTLTAAGCTVETYVFDIQSLQNQHIMWWPCTIPEATVAMSAVGAGDVTPPAATNVGVQGGCNIITVSWTDTGDDGTTGQATGYEVRRSEAPITEANYAAATIVTGGAPGPSGTLESIQDVVGQCSPTLYYAVKLTDNVGNVSALGSNGSGHTLCPTNHPCEDGITITQEGANNGPTTLQLAGNTPSVVQAAVTLAFALPLRSAHHEVLVNLVDMSGRRVRQMHVAASSAGQASAVWDLHDDTGHRVSPGVYFMRAEAGPMRLVHRFVVLN